VDLGHSRLAFRAVGSGPPLLLVHGYPLSGLTWRHVVPKLAAHFTCYVPDLPGAGDTVCSKETDYNFKAQALTLQAFADALGLASYAVLAQDTGATIARRLALIDTARVTRLMLLSTEIPGHRPPWIPLFQKISNPNATFALRALLKLKAFRQSSAGFGGCFHDTALIEGEFFQRFIQPLIDSPAKASGQIRYLLGIDWAVVDGLKTEHAKITAPVLLVWGEDDPVFPVALARDMARQFPNCKGFITIPKAKLLLQEEHPKTVADIALKFLCTEEAAKREAVH
jgi:pimeloyl-ACP methyl ester carboxylesterase